MGVRTYPSFSPRGGLDRIYHRGPFRQIAARSCRLRASRVASDHLPIIVDPSHASGRADYVAALARAAAACNARLLHISTDFVFDCEAVEPYRPDSATNPVSVYGQTKRDGETAVLEAMPDTGAVVRTAWLYSKTGSNFVKTMLRLMAERDELGVVADQRGTPTWAHSLAEAVWALVDVREFHGIHHWTDAGECTWHEFAIAIQEEALALGLLERAIPIHPIASEDYPTAARRPRVSEFLVAKSVTSTPRSARPSHSRETTCSQGP